MTWFLKGKIKKSMKRIKQLEKEINTEANKYNSLVQEYQMENSFMNIQKAPDELPALRESKGTGDKSESFEL